MLKKIFISNILFSFLIYILINIPVCAQQDNNPEKEFQHAVNLYGSGEYNEALPVFKKIGVDMPYNQETTAAYLFIGKTYLEMNDLNSANEFLLDFLKKYPSSEYVDEAQLALVKVYYLEKEYKKAFGYILNLVSKPESNDYKKYAVKLGEQFAVNYVELYDLKNISTSASDNSLKPYLLLLVGKKEQMAGNYTLASESYKEIIDTYPGSEQLKEANRLFKQLKSIKDETSSEDNLLAVLLPLTNKKSGEKITAGGEILEGIKYAASRYNLDHQKKVGLIIKDTGTDSSQIDILKTEIGSNPAVKAVIGPVFSNEVRYTLEAFKDSGLPVISPTATDNDLTGLSDNFFQANPSFSMRGKVIAQYIYYVAGKKNIGVLNAIGGYSPLEAGAFKKEFQKIGGTIISSGIYNSGAYDLSNPVASLAADSEKIEGIYLPISDKMDATALLSQMVQQQIKLPIFGNQDWFYAKGLETSSVLSDQLSLTSDFFIDYNDSTFNSFSKDFIEQTGIDVNRNVLYGYDAANYILSLISDGADTRASLIHEMESGIEVKGYHNNIAFGKEHINRFLNVIRYSDGKFELVDRFKSGE